MKTSLQHEGKHCPPHHICYPAQLCLALFTTTNQPCNSHTLKPPSQSSQARGGAKDLMSSHGPCLGFNNTTKARSMVGGRGGGGRGVSGGGGRTGSLDERVMTVDGRVRPAANSVLTRTHTHFPSPHFSLSTHELPRHYLLVKPLPELGEETKRHEGYYLSCFVWVSRPEEMRSSHLCLGAGNSRGRKTQTGAGRVPHRIGKTIDPCFYATTQGCLQMRPLCRCVVLSAVWRTAFTVQQTARF